MHRYIAASIIFLLLLAGCSDKQMFAEPPKTTDKKENGQKPEEIFEKPKIINNLSNQSSSDDNALLMAALDSIDDGDIDTAQNYFLQLYKQSGDRDYLKEIIKILHSKKEHNAAIELLEKELQKSDDNELKKMLISELLQVKNFKKAKEIATETAEASKTKDDYDLAANIYVLLGDYTAALKYFKLSYGVKADDETIDKIATILFINFGKKNEAISYYETHIRLYGCSKLVCERLAKAHEEMHNYKSSAEIYKKLYWKFKDEKYSKQVIDLFLTLREIDSLVEFLSKSRANDEVLLETYKYKKEYKKASEIAFSIYKKSGNLEYLAQHAIFKFESQEKKDKTLIDDTITNLETVVQSYDNDIYLNYLGYMLIDYDKDPAKGVELVKQALLKNGDSPYYLDSLAWGYFKLKKCAEAYEIISSVKTMLKDDKTVKEHYKHIKTCYDKMKSEDKSSFKKNILDFFTK